MIDLKPVIYQALTQDEELVTLLGGPHIYQLTAPDATVYPRVTFFELDNVDSDYADDAPMAASVSVQVDVWSKGSFADIVQRVNAVMESLGFVRYYATDLYEADTGVYHKALRYQAVREV